MQLKELEELLLNYPANSEVRIKVFYRGGWIPVEFDLTHTSFSFTNKGNEGISYILCKG